MSLLNAFDSANYPTEVPTTLVAGTRWAWKLGTLSSAYPSASYSVKWVARAEAGAANASEISITGSASGSDYLFEAAGTTTDGYATGRHAWQLIVTRTSDSETVPVGSGIVTITPDRDTQSGDLRSHARRTLEAIEAMLEGRADSSVQSYTLEGRSIGHYTISELLQFRDRYRREVASEIAAARAARGLAGGGLIRARFVG